MRRILSVVSGVVLVGCVVAGCGQVNQGPSPATSSLASAAIVGLPPVAIPAKRELVLVPSRLRGVSVGLSFDLAKEYRDNEAAADAKYTGKIVEMNVMGKIEKQADGRYSLACWATDPPQNFEPPAVICKIAPASDGYLAQAKPRQVMRLRGVCKGKSATDFGAVMLDDCEITAFVEWVNGDYRPVK